MCSLLLFLCGFASNPAWRHTSPFASQLWPFYFSLMPTPGHRGKWPSLMWTLMRSKTATFEKQMANIREVITCMLVESCRGAHFLNTILHRTRSRRGCPRKIPKPTAIGMVFGRVLGRALQADQFPTTHICTYAAAEIRASSLCCAAEIRGSSLCCSSD